MSKLWGAMRGMQMITYPTLILVTYPANIFIFYQILIKVSNIDIIGKYLEDNVYGKMPFVET